MTYDYPIVYVRVPRPYPKTYSGINHLNQAGLHQTNAPGAELRLLHPDGRDEALVPVEPQESITDPVVSFDAQWVYFAKFHHMTTGPSASMTMLAECLICVIFRPSSGLFSPDESGVPGSLLAQPT